MSILLYAFYIILYLNYHHPCLEICRNYNHVCIICAAANSVAFIIVFLYTQGVDFICDVLRSITVL